LGFGEISLAATEITLSTSIHAVTNLLLSSKLDVLPTTTRFTIAPLANFHQGLQKQQQQQQQQQQLLSLGTTVAATDLASAAGGGLHC
jgi:hypothetical protein